MPHAMNWNLSIERELPGRTILHVGYVGSHGTGLIVSRSANPATPAGVAACLADRTCVSNRSVQVLTNPDHYQYDGSVWGNFGVQTNGGWSNYNALQVTVNKHMSHGLEFQSAYTWSHSLDVSSSFEDTSFSYSGGADAYGHYGRDYGSSSFDARHRWTVTFIYEVPNVAKNLGAGPQPGVRRMELDGNHTFQSGFPIYFQDSNMGSLNCTWFFLFYGCPDRPDIVKAPVKLDPRTATFSGKTNYWFDPSSFAHNAYGTEGTTPRGYFTGPGYWDADFTIKKAIPITEGKSFSVQMDTFNLFNHTNFGQPNGNRGSGSFGRITGIRNFTNSRLVQLGAKFTF